MKTDTKILAAEFDYLQCLTLADALAFLAQHQEKAKILAGGTDLIVKMKIGSVQCEQVISIQNIEELNYLRSDTDSLKIGAVTTLREVEGSEVVKARYSALFEAVRSMAATSVRNMGTIGGNLCNGSPAADTAPPLLVFDATVNLASKCGERIVPITEFFLGPGKTTLAVDEVLTEITIPMPGEYTGSSFLKLGRVAADIAKISVAVFIQRSGQTCSVCRIALGSVAPVPLRVPEAEAMLVGNTVTPELIIAVAKTAATLIRPITDNRSTSSYRSKVSPIILEEAITAAWQRSGGEL